MHKILESLNTKNISKRDIFTKPGDSNYILSRHTHCIVINIFGYPSL